MCRVLGSGSITKVKHIGTHIVMQQSLRGKKKIELLVCTFSELLMLLSIVAVYCSCLLRRAQSVAQAGLELWALLSPP